MLRMAKSKPHGCDAHSTRCTQLLIDTRLAVDHQKVTVYFHRHYSEFWCRASKDLGEEARGLAPMQGHTTG